MCQPKNRLVGDIGLEPTTPTMSTKTSPFSISSINILDTYLLATYDYYQNAPNTPKQPSDIQNLSPTCHRTVTIGRTHTSFSMFLYQFNLAHFLIACKWHLKRGLVGQLSQIRAGVFKVIKYSVP